MTDCPIVTLSWAEMHLCATVAAMRQISALRRLAQPRHGANGMGAFDMHLFGCVGEFAVAKHLNLFWAASPGVLEPNDVGGKLQVRAAYQENYRLILHDSDSSDDPFVLALAHDLPRVTLRGWVFGRDGKLRKYWADPVGGRPAYFVPQESLVAMHELAPLVAAHAGRPA